MASVVILGAGLTGLSVAYHLEQNGFYDYQLFESNTTIGGLVRSVKQEGFTFDYTGHLIHINDSYFRTFLDHVLGFDNLGTHNRKAFVYSHHTYTPFPFQMNLFGLPSHVITECILGFVHRKKKRTPHNFRDWVLTYFGSGLGKHFFFPYNSKMLCSKLVDIMATWNGKYVPKTSLSDLLVGALEAQSPSVGYNKQFYYPKTSGIQYFSDSIANHLTRPVLTEHVAVSINLKRKEVIFSNGRTEPYTTLVSTMPLPKLLRMLEEPTSSTMHQCADYLKATSVLNFNMGLNIPNISNKHWIYFPEKKYPFYRLGFSHNFSSTLVPEGCSALYGEIAYLAGNTSPKDLALKQRQAEEYVYQLLGISDANVITTCLLTLQEAYVIYDTWRERNIKKLLMSLEGYDIHSVGRFGAWEYSSMQDAILDGKQTALTVCMQQGHALSPTILPSTVTLNERITERSGKLIHNRPQP